METLGSRASVLSSPAGNTWFWVSAAAMRCSAASLARMRVASSPAAFRVKVTPSTSSGRTQPLATSHTTRSAMVAVLPEPAPAMTSRGDSGEEMMCDCSAVGLFFSPSMAESSSGVNRGAGRVRARRRAAAAGTDVGVSALIR